MMASLPPLIRGKKLNHPLHSQKVHIIPIEKIHLKIKILLIVRMKILPTEEILTMQLLQQAEKREG